MIDIREGATIETRNGCLSVHATYIRNPKTNKVEEVQWHAGRNGSCHNTWYKIANILFNYILELGGSRHEVAKRLVDDKHGGVESCNVPIITEGKKVKSCAHCITRIITELWDKNEGESDAKA